MVRLIWRRLVRYRPACDPGRTETCLSLACTPHRALRPCAAAGSTHAGPGGRPPCRRRAAAAAAAAGLATHRHQHSAAGAAGMDAGRAAAAAGPAGGAAAAGRDADAVGRVGLAAAAAPGRGPAAAGATTEAGGAKGAKGAAAAGVWYLLCSRRGAGCMPAGWPALPPQPPALPLRCSINALASGRPLPWPPTDHC